MSGMSALLLTVMYIVIFFVGRMVGLNEGKEIAIKVIKEWEDQLNK
jgi:hypothetical protein